MHLPSTFLTLICVAGIAAAADDGTPIGELGRVNIAQPNAATWHTVALRNRLADPVVVLGPVSSNGGQPVVGRVRNRTPTSFQVQLDEWDYLDQSHAAEDVGFFVIDRGVHLLVDGQLRIEANTCRVGAPAVRVNFAGAFAAPPLVFAQVSSAGDGRTAVARVSGIDSTGFTVRVQGQEANRSVATVEVSWVAVTPGLYSGGTLFTAYPAPVGSTYTDVFAPYPQLYPSSTAAFVAGMQTFQDADPAGLRFRLLPDNQYELRVQEETSRSSDVRHLPEQVGRHARHVVEEIARVEKAVDLLKQGDGAAFGQLMVEGHASLRDLYQVSIPELDRLVEIATCLPGCLGARLTGAGFGGCTVNLVEEQAAQAFAQRLAQEYTLRTGKTGEIYLCHASEGVHVQTG